MRVRRSSSRVRYRRLFVVATKCPGAEVWSVYRARRGSRHVSLAARTTAHRVVIPVETSSTVKSGTVTLKESSAGHTVTIEGLGVLLGWTLPRVRVRVTTRRGANLRDRVTRVGTRSSPASCSIVPGTVARRPEVGLFALRIRVRALVPFVRVRHYWAGRACSHDRTAVTTRHALRIRGGS